MAENSVLSMLRTLSLHFLSDHPTMFKYLKWIIGGIIALLIAFVFHDILDTSPDIYKVFKVMAPHLPLITGAKLIRPKTHRLNKHLKPNGFPYDDVIISATIFHPVEKKICLLVHNDAKRGYQRVFELPNGGFDTSHSSLFAGLVTAVKGMTGLEIKMILTELDPSIYHFHGEVDGKMVTKSCIQLNFVVWAEGEVIKVHPKLHSWGFGVGEEELGDLEMTEVTRRVVEEAWRWRSKNLR